MECVVCYEFDIPSKPLVVLSCCSKLVHDECLIRSNVNQCMMCRSMLFMALPVAYADDVARVRKFELSLPNLRTKLPDSFKTRLDMFVNAIRCVSPVHLFNNEYILSSLMAFSDVNVVVGPERNTMLHYAACTSLKIIVELVRRGANVNARNVLNSTPLVYSLVKKKWDLAAKLLELGAAVYNKVMYMAVEKDVPTYLLRMMLLRVRNSQSLYFERSENILQYLVKKQKSELLSVALEEPVTKPLLLGSNIIEYAIKMKSDSVIPILLDANVPVNSFVATAAVNNNVHHSVLKQILEKFTSAQSLYVTDRYNTVLHHVLRKGDIEVTNIALALPAFAELLTDAEENYLDYAILHSDVANSRAVLDCGCRRISNKLEVANKLACLQTTNPQFIDDMCCLAIMSFSMFESFCSSVSDKYGCALSLVKEPKRVNSTALIKKLQALDLDFNHQYEGGLTLESFTSNKRVRDYILSKKQ